MEPCKEIPLPVSEEMTGNERKKSVKIVSSTLTPEKGSFALEGDPVKWEVCRERFAAVFDETTPGFFFSHQNVHDNVSKFLLKTEQILELKDNSVVVPTNQSNFSWVEPSDFWKNCSLRRNLLTVFLRCGLYYSNDYHEALERNPLTKQTIKAIYRFLYGFTKYTGDPVMPNYSTTSLISRGWVQIFTPNTNEPNYEERIKKLLIRDGQNEKYLAVIEDAIWM